jgi:cytochrome c5
MKKKYLLIPFAILLAAFILIQCTSAGNSTQSNQPATQNNSPDGATLVSQRCTTCHSEGPITSQRLTKAEWTDVVNQMIQKGASLSDSEKVIVIDYLTATYSK